MTGTTTHGGESGAAETAWRFYAAELQARHHVSESELETVEIDYKRGFADALRQTGTT